MKVRISIVLGYETINNKKELEKRTKIILIKKKDSLKRKENIKNINKTRMTTFIKTKIKKSDGQTNIK